MGYQSKYTGEQVERVLDIVNNIEVYNKSEIDKRLSDMLTIISQMKLNLNDLWVEIDSNERQGTY